jgi:ATPase subunit of ABC transporter with duplicated ATPase domains
MATLSIQNAGLSYSEVLFSNLTFGIHDGDRLGIVANNGAGKSTLLKCLAGTIEPMSGAISRPNNLKIGFLDQTMPEGIRSLPFRDAIIRALPPEQRVSNGWRGDYVLDSFSAPAEIRERPLAELSGGWQRLALVARMWISDPDILLLDEPTNHLDLSKILMLEGWLNQELSDVPLIVVSHDRRFLDGCTNKTLFLRQTESKLYSHPYSRARQLLSDDDAAIEAKREREMKELSRLKRSAHDLRQIGKNNFSDAALRKSNLMSKRARAAEDSLTSIHVEERRDIKLSNRGTHSNRLIALENITVSTPTGRRLFSIGKLAIGQQERVVVLGRNGSGKTCFIEYLRGVISNRAVAPSSGVTISSTVALSYVDQHMSQLPSNQTARDFINSDFKLGEQRAISVLASAGFTFDQQTQKIATLSPGQKSRLALLAIRLALPNFYLMDEPTNHLDIAGQEQFESEICSLGATAIIVSHDRRFIENVGTRFLLIEGARLLQIDSPEIFHRSLLDDVPVSTLLKKVVPC